MMTIILTVALSAGVSSIIGYSFSAFSKKQSTKAMDNKQYKEQVYRELLCPVYMNFKRIRNAYIRLVKRESISYVEIQTVVESHQNIRELLKSKPELIPSELIEDALKIIFYMDVWFEQYNQLKLERKSVAKYCFVGPKGGHPFPTTSEKEFFAVLDKYKKELNKI